MLARLLRRLYFMQVLGGALLGSILALREAPSSLAWLLTSILLGSVLLPLSLQFLVIATSMVKSRDGAASWLWWRVFWGEFKAAMTVFVGRLPWSDKGPGVQMPVTTPSGQSATNSLPVLLVHGYICNHRVWDDVAPALRKAGHPVLAIDLEPLFASIDDYAALIDDAVTELLGKCDATQVAVVGHSMGGLAIRAWMRQHGTARVARVVTLGTPHQGTRIANASMTLNGTQMVWHSAWLKELEQSETPAVRGLMTLALTHQDNVVFPQRAQVLAGSTVVEFSGLGHLELCLDHSVIQWLVAQLANQ